jgi:hypothetical protein
MLCFPLELLDGLAQLYRFTADLGVDAETPDSSYEE